MSFSRIQAPGVSLAAISAQNGPIFAQGQSMKDKARAQNEANIAGLQEVMKRLSLAINVAGTVMPRDMTGYIPNALLNVTISRMIDVEGRINTAILLSTLSDLLKQGANPEKLGPINLPRKHP
jgi:hypothetical protein